MTAHRFAAGAALAALVATAAPAKDKVPDLAPWKVTVDVRWGDVRGPDAFRADVARALAGSLGRECAGGVDTRPPSDSGADLALVVVLAGYAEELSFDDSIAVAATPGDPGKELRRVAYVAVDTDARLLTRAAGTEVAAKSFHVEQSYRPVYLGEDPQVTARGRTIERLVQEMTRALCGSKGKLAAKVRATLAADEEAGAEPR